MTNEQEKIMEIAEAHLTPYNERDRQKRMLTWCGLCHAFNCSGIESSLLSRFHSTLKYWLPVRIYGNYRMTEADEIRGTFCLLLALMPEGDFKEIMG